jgi:hypothetical protein
MISERPGESACGEERPPATRSSAARRARAANLSSPGKSRKRCACFGGQRGVYDVAFLRRNAVSEPQRGTYGAGAALTVQRRLE